jgi:ankyrin repeat protein
MAAALTGDDAIVKVMIERGADVNTRDRFGWTALRFAAWKGHTDIVELLRQAGGDQ